MDRRTYLKHALVLSGGLLAPAGIMSLIGKHGVVNSPELAGFNGKIMGTGYSVRLGLPVNDIALIDQSSNKSAFAKYKNLSDNVAIDSLARRVHVTLQAVDTRMSTWLDDSELSLLNKRSDKNWQKISASTYSVIDRALHVSHLSSGAFDLSVGPLVDLWGFGAKAGISLRLCSALVITQSSLADQHTQFENLSRPPDSIYQELRKGMR